MIVSFKKELGYIDRLFICNNFDRYIQIIEIILENIDIFLNI